MPVTVTWHPESASCALGGAVHELTVSAAARAAARAVQFRADGYWTTDPVDLVADAARHTPARVAAAQRGESLTYRELNGAVDGAVAALRAEDVTPGDAVFVLAANDLVSVIAIHAVMRLGAVVMVAPTNAGDAQVRDIVMATKPSIVLAPSG